jgi:pimeloyl-ACP methyl ester carboxylesterase
MNTHPPGELAMRSRLNVRNHRRQQLNEQMLRYLLVLLSTFAFVSCTTIPCADHEHILMFGIDGAPLDPTGNFGPRCKATTGGVSDYCNGRHTWLKFYHHMSPQLYKRQRQQLLAALLRQQLPRPDHKGKILIYIHGGLNTQVGSIERAAALHQEIEAAGFYPIFINWQSSLPTSYFEHLFMTRQGLNWHFTKGLWLAPFYLAGDLARGLAYTPMVAVYEWHKFVQMKPDVERRPHSPPNDAADEIVPCASTIDLEEGGEPQPARGRIEFQRAATIPLLPAHLAAGILVESAGRSSWDIMLRRTQLLFHTDREFEDEPKGLLKLNNKNVRNLKASGGLAIFLMDLKDFISANGGSDRWEITVVGHSMGAIVLNRMVKEFPELPYHDLIYLASAASVNDLEYVARDYLSEHGDVNLWLLTLNGKSEYREHSGFGLFPYGSLLVWIDEMLKAPEIHLDRTAGRIANLEPALHDFPCDVRTRIHIRSLEAGELGQPQTHGQLGQIRFWKRDCYAPAAAYPDVCRISAPACPALLK